MPRRKKASIEHRFRLKPADPFELIRWLARSQSDPRKAVAELVQNSLDAAARVVRIERIRLRREPSLVVRDDGEGVLPDLGREEALEYLATHVGHSRKLQIDPAERQRRVIAGQYGVGLLGFWAIGRHLELRTRLGGSPVFALRLEEDSPNASIQRVPGRTDDPDTFTEVVVGPLHPAAQKALGGRRLADYLAAELRGQLLRSGVSVRIHDRIARGLAQRRFEVAPLRFTGERLALPSEVEVPGHLPLHVELYLARGAERPAIQVAAAGTLIADDAAELSAIGIAEHPWVGAELTGLLDFAGFRVPPGSRRGVLPDAGSQAFVAALERLRPMVEAELERFESERQKSLERDVVRDLQKALKGFRQRLPQYEMPRVVGRSEPVSVVRDGEPPSGSASDGAGLVASPERDPMPPRETSLFPPGPLASVSIVPRQVAVAPGEERRVRAVPVDAGGRLPEDVIFAWTLDSPAMGITLSGDGPRPAVVADARAREGTSVTLRVEAFQGALRATAEATVLVHLREPDDGAVGIPEPNLVSDADGRWRSRMAGERWEVNDAHEDYRALRTDPRGRIRYLLTLLAKEIVLRSAGRPDVEGLLESMAEVLAHAERNLRGS